MDHLIVVHGIRDNDSWANRVAARFAGPHRKTYTYPFNYFSLFSFINPLSRHAAADRMRRALDEKFDDITGNDTVSFVGHSFGTHLIFQFVTRMHASYRFGSVTFVSSVLHSFVAPRIIGKCQRFHNFAAVRDWVLLLNNLLPFPSAGLAGRIGCAGYVADTDNGDSFFDTDHSGWFGARRDGESADWFIGGPLEDFLGGRPVESEVARPRLDGWIVASLNAYKLILPSLIVVLGFLVFTNVAGAITNAQFAANSELAQRYTVEADAALAADDPSEALRLASAAMPNGRSNWPFSEATFATLLQALSTPRPIEEEISFDLPFYGVEQGVSYGDVIGATVARLAGRIPGEIGVPDPLSGFEIWRPAGRVTDGLIMARDDEGTSAVATLRNGEFSVLGQCADLDSVWFAFEEGDRLFGIGAADGYLAWRSFEVRGSECTTKPIARTALGGSGHSQAYISWHTGSTKVAIEQERSFLLFDSRDQRANPPCDTRQIVPRLLDVAVTAYDWYLAVDVEGQAWRLAPDCRRLGDPILAVGDSVTWASTQNTPGRSRLLAVTEGSVWLIRDNGEPVELPYDGAVEFASFTVDGRHVAIIGGAMTSLFDADTGAPVAAIPNLVSSNFLMTTSGNNVVPEISVTGETIVSNGYPRRAVWRLTPTQWPPLPGGQEAVFTDAGKLAVTGPPFDPNRPFLFDPSSKRVLLAPALSARRSSIVDPKSESVFTTDVTGGVHAARFGDDRYIVIEGGDGDPESSAELGLQTGSRAWFVATTETSVLAIEPESFRVVSRATLPDGAYVSSVSVADDGSLLVFMEGVVLAVGPAGAHEITSPVADASPTLVPIGGLAISLTDTEAALWGSGGHVAWRSDLSWSDLPKESIALWQSRISDDYRIAAGVALEDGGVLLVTHQNEALRIFPSGKLREYRGVEDGLPFTELLVTRVAGTGTIEVAKISDIDHPLAIPDAFTVVAMSRDQTAVFAEKEGAIYRFDFATGAITGIAACSCDFGDYVFSRDGQLIYDGTFGLREFFPYDVAAIEATARSAIPPSVEEP